MGRAEVGGGLMDMCGGKRKSGLTTACGDGRGLGWVGLGDLVVEAGGAGGAGGWWWVVVGGCVRVVGRRSSGVGAAGGGKSGRVE